MDYLGVSSGPRFSCPFRMNFSGIPFILLPSLKDSPTSVGVIVQIPFITDLRWLISYFSVVKVGEQLQHASGVMVISWGLHMPPRMATILMIRFALKTNPTEFGQA